MISISKLVLIIGIGLVSAYALYSEYLVKDEATTEATTELSIYIACANGSIKAVSETGGLPDNRADFIEFLQELDYNCVEWTKAWFPAFGDRKEFSTLSKEQLNLFNTQKQQQLTNFMNSVPVREMLDIQK